MKSRGRGDVQNAILDVLDRDGALPFSSIAWRVALNLKYIGPGDDLAPETYNSVHRAARDFCGPKQLQLVRSRRVFQRLDDFVLLCPEHTTEAVTRDARRVLLPHVKTFVQLVKGRVRRAHQSEEAALAALTAAERQGLADAWGAAEAALFESIGDLTSPHRVLVSETIARGRELLLNASGVRASFTLFGALNALEAVPIPPSGRAALARLRSLMPRDKFDHQRVKAALFPVVDLSKGQRATLKQGFKEDLLEVEQAFIESLPGHVPVLPRRRSMLELLRPDSGPTYSRELDKLILHNAYKQFWVYRLACDPADSVPRSR